MQHQGSLTLVLSASLPPHRFTAQLLSYTGIAETGPATESRTTAEEMRTSCEEARTGMGSPLYLFLLRKNSRFLGDRDSQEPPSRYWDEPGHHSPCLPLKSYLSGHLAADSTSLPSLLPAEGPRKGPPH